MSFETPESLAIELCTFTENDGQIYRSQTQSILKNLATKKASGKYDREKAVTLFMYLAETGARAFAKDSGAPESSWKDMFPINVRRIAAARWRDEFEGEYALGNYDNLVPKKYQQQKSMVAARGPLYREGEDHAQHVAANLPSKSAFEYILGHQKVFPHARYHIPEIAHLPTPKNSKKAEFKLGFLNRLRAILDAMEGN